MARRKLPDPPPADLPFLTVREAAAYLRLGKTTTYSLIDAGRLDAVNVYGRARRVTRKSVERYAADRQAEAVR